MLSLFRIRIATLRGNRSRREVRWVNPAFVTAAVEDCEEGNGVSLYVAGMDRWQCTDGIEHLLEGLRSCRRIRPQMLAIEVSVLHGNTPRTERRHVSTNRVIAIEPEADNGYTMHVEGMDSWQCVRPPLDELLR